MPDADNTLNRVDRVVLQFDTSSNLTAIRLNTGTPAVAAQPPDILQNHNQYELGLCTISVPAGSAAVTSADITDTRTDEAVCGLMRDGVTGIPTETLLAQYTAILTAMQQSGNAQLQQLAESIKAVDSGSFYTKEQADAKFGTPYSLPPATADQLGGVKVGEALGLQPCAGGYRPRDRSGAARTAHRGRYRGRGRSRIAGLQLRLRCLLWQRQPARM